VKATPTISASVGETAPGNLRWTHIFDSKLFTNVSAVVSDYRFGSEIEEWDRTRFKTVSGILDYSLRGEAEYFHSAEHTFKAGAELTLHTFTSEASSDINEFFDFDAFLPTHRGTELSLFLQDDWKVSEHLTAQLGGRAFYFDPGPTSASNRGWRRSIRSKTRLH
jgi:outer membrane receptor protein involved in Fe transport